MEKISGIIPSTQRVSSVDLKDAAPVRPGTPSFGRPQGISSLAKPMISTQSDINRLAPMSTAVAATGLMPEKLTWRQEDQRKANAAAEVSNAFFMKNTTEAEPVHDIEPVRLIPVDEMPARSVPSGFKSDTLSAMRAAMPVTSYDDGFDSEPEIQQPEGLYPKGSFLDKTA
jgi:hypothetical protein